MKNLFVFACISFGIFINACESFGQTITKERKAKNKNSQLRFTLNKKSEIEKFTFTAIVDGQPMKFCTDCKDEKSQVQLVIRPPKPPCVCPVGIPYTVIHKPDLKSITIVNDKGIKVAEFSYKNRGRNSFAAFEKTLN